MNFLLTPIRSGLGAWLMISLYLFTSCEKSDLKERCFTKSSLEGTPWVKQHLSGFQQPKAGPLSVVVYSYQGQEYLVFSNPFLSSPMSNIFNCAGQRLTQLGIPYNQFMKDAKRVDVLLEKTY
ncbi:hypothetical protein ACFQ4C_19310 [Larkinella insperata]|uniref:Spi protease inhibitor domain-containing protein n=1 Tax=Larkinella insperata TaxID=332158 RepID=A0ABW3QNF3_9BACT|nr:hypothetical protein [Larkinella insperata]